MEITTTTNRTSALASRGICVTKGTRGPGASMLCMQVRQGRACCHSNADCPALTVCLLLVSGFTLTAALGLLCDTLEHLRGFRSSGVEPVVPGCSLVITVTSHLAKPFPADNEPHILILAYEGAGDFYQPLQALRAAVNKHCKGLQAHNTIAHALLAIEHFPGSDRVFMVLKASMDWPASNQGPLCVKLIHTYR